MPRIHTTSHVRPVHHHASHALSATSQKIAGALTKGLPDVVDHKLLSMMKDPVVSESSLPPENARARGKVTLTYTVGSAKAAKEIVEGFGPMDDENLLTDNIEWPEGMDTVDAHARGNKVVIASEWSAPRSKKPKAVEAALGMMSNYIIDSSKRGVSVITPQIKVSGDDAHGKMTLSYEIRSSSTFEKLDAAHVQRLAGGLKMDRATLESHYIKLPAFVQSATVKGHGSHLVVEATW